MFKINTSKDAVAESNGSSFINKSGIYDVMIKFASVDTSKGGAKSVNFNLNYNGNDQTIYGPYVQSKAGDQLDIGMNLINKLGIIAGLGNGDGLEIEQEEHIVGKDKKSQEFAVITNFSDLPVKIRIQLEYSKYNGDISERKVIKSFFREDGASAEEIVNESEAGKRLALETDRYADNITYKDDLTPEDVAAWIDAKRGKGGLTPTPKAAQNKPAANLFG